METRAVWLAGGMSFRLSSARNNLMEKRGNTSEEDIICQYCFVVQSETLHPAGSVCSLQNDTSTINIAGYSPFFVSCCLSSLELPRPFLHVGLKFSPLVFDGSAS